MPWELLSALLQSSPSRKAYLNKSYRCCILCGIWLQRYLEIFHLCPGDLKV